MSSKFLLHLPNPCNTGHAKIQPYDSPGHRSAWHSSLMPLNRIKWRDAWWMLTRTIPDRFDVSGHSRAVSLLKKNLYNSVQFSRSVMSDSLWPHGLQHARPPCPSPTPGVYWNSYPLSQRCHPTISSSVIPFSSCLQSFPSGSFQKSQFFASDGQSIGVSASASVLPMNIQDWFPLGLTGLISSQSKGLSRVFSNPTVQKH